MRQPINNQSINQSIPFAPLPCATELLRVRFPALLTCLYCCLFNVVTIRDDKVLALFNPSHVRYEYDRETESPDELSIMEMTKVAMNLLSKNPNGYYLMVEAGRVDHANHAGNLYRT